MGIAHATVTLAHKSNLPRDNIVNTFTFRSPGDFVNVADEDAILAALNKFYTQINESATQPLAKYLGTQLSRTVPPKLRIYDITTHLDGTPAGSPQTIRDMTLLPAELDSNPLPSEICLAMSFRAGYGADVEFAPGSRPRSRDRGRIFIGPLTPSQVVAGTGSRAVPTTVLMNVINESGHALMADPNTDWVVWSRAAARVASVVEVSVDDAFDTQRSRGERPTVRTIAS